jgi:hypothetical protein
VTFGFILGYFLFTFALFFLFTTEVKDSATHESENVQDYLWTELKHILPFATGGFVLEGEMSTAHAIGQSLVVFIITILMLNLLVGILSEKLGDVVANKTISSYRLLLQICIENEIFSMLFPFNRAEDERGAHLVYAVGEEEH